MTSDDKAKLDAFETARPRLWGLAYRMLGSVADAEDALQDTFLKWSQTDMASVHTPQAWLTTACTRRCLDMLRAAHRTRVDYVGPWLPEPTVTTDSLAEAERMELAASLSTAFLLLLERLSPSERAAYLLREIFDVDYSDIASALNKSEASCRQLVSRAKRQITDEKPRYAPPSPKQDRLLDEFLQAIRTGSTDALETLLADDVEAWIDAGGRAPAVAERVSGARDVIALFELLWSKFWRDRTLDVIRLNGSLGVVARDNGAPATAMTLSLDADGRISRFYLVRNPEKLARL